VQIPGKPAKQSTLLLPPPLSRHFNYLVILMMYDGHQLIAFSSTNLLSYKVTSSQDSNFGPASNLAPVSILALALPMNTFISLE
jgi:hypothetical protein